MLSVDHEQRDCDKDQYTAKEPHSQVLLWSVIHTSVSRALSAVSCQVLLWSVIHTTVFRALSAVSCHVLLWLVIHVYLCFQAPQCCVLSGTAVIGHPYLCFQGPQCCVLLGTVVIGHTYHCFQGPQRCVLSGTAVIGHTCIPLFPGPSVQCLVRYCCDKVIHTTVSRPLSAVSCQVQMFWHWWTWARHFQELGNGPQESSVSEQCFILLPVPKGFVPLTFISFSLFLSCVLDIVHRILFLKSPILVPAKPGSGLLMLLLGIFSG